MRLEFSRFDSQEMRRIALQAEPATFAGIPVPLGITEEHHHLIGRVVAAVVNRLRRDETDLWIRASERAE